MQRVPQGKRTERVATLDRTMRTVRVLSHMKRVSRGKMHGNGHASAMRGGLENPLQCMSKNQAAYSHRTFALGKATPAWFVRPNFSSGVLVPTCCLGSCCGSKGATSFPQHTMYYVIYYTILYYIVLYYTSYHIILYHSMVS